jgi:omega-6 fatty acid desaturase (delta-12 desaturase)
VWSDVGLIAALVGLGYAINTFGLMLVTKYYLVPYMIVNYHLVLITYLQHTDVFIPHFRGKASAFIHRDPRRWLRHHTSPA